MDHQQRTFAQLVDRARGGDRLAQQELWVSHRRWVAAIILAHRPSAVEVDDLLQEVALKLVDKLPTLRDSAAFRSWLRQIVLNICRGAGRALKPTLSLNHGSTNGDSSLNNIAASGGSDDNQVDRNELAERLLSQTLTLPPEYREPLLLRSLNAMSYQQISLTLGLPVTTIETRLARARRMLREECDVDGSLNHAGGTGQQP